MKIALIHGQSHKGSTYHISRLLAEKLGGEITEFMLPRDFSDHCLGCCTCFEISEKKCPHRSRLEPIVKAIDEADVIILASPVYVMHTSGSMKNLLDHMGWRWTIHRPEAKMFTKQAVCISTAAGMGMKSANKDMSDSLFFWGVGKIYRYGAAVRESSWEKVDPAMKQKISRSMDKLADTVYENIGRVTPSVKTKTMFEIIRQMRFIYGTDKDIKYWKKKGWLENKRPWKE